VLDDDEDDDDDDDDDSVNSMTKSGHGVRSKHWRTVTLSITVRHHLSIFTSIIGTVKSRHSVCDEHRAQSVRHVCYGITTPLLNATQFH